MTRRPQMTGRINVPMSRVMEGDIKRLAQNRGITAAEYLRRLARRDIDRNGWRIPAIKDKLHTV